MSRLQAGGCLCPGCFPGMAVHTCVQDLEGASKETKWAEQMVQFRWAGQSVNEHSLLPAPIRWLTNFCSSNSRES